MQTSDFYNNPHSQPYPDPKPRTPNGLGQHSSTDMNPYQYPQTPYGQQQQQQHPPPQQRPTYYQQLPPPHTMGIPQPQSSSSIPSLTGHPGYGAPPHSGLALPPGPSSVQERAPIQMSYSGSTDKYRYTLVVAQQPQRARMCGFGDKDRRPITPPPCVRLDLTDLNGNPVDIESIDGSFFVLQVDLWSHTADREVNIVRASNSTPTTSISTATTTSFPPTMEPRDPMMFYPNNAGSYGLASMPPPGQYPGYPPGMHVPPHMVHPVQSYMQGGPPSGTMFTRNLIGSLTVNASRLNDPDNNSSYWFVLQDLSVRTEGFFR